MNVILKQITELLASSGITATKELVISLAIKGITDMGVSATDAASLILGDGMIDELYSSLKA